MSSVFSGTMQGSFTSNGQNQIIPLREGVDWMLVYNTTVAAANQTTAVGVKYYWQLGFPAGSEWVTYKSNAAAAANLEQYITTGGFTFVNTTINTPQASVAITSISSGTPPVVTQTPALNAGALSNGQTVRIFNTVGGQQLGGLDFTVGAVTPGGAGTGTFTLAYAPTIAAATTGSYRIIPYNPYFYPPTRVISAIESSTLAGQQTTIVTMTVTHSFTVGQNVRLIIPTVTSSAYGMTSLNGVAGNIVAINQADANGVTNTITLDINSSAAGTFAWPLTTDPFSTPAQVVPVGESMAVAVNPNPTLYPNGVNVIGDSELNTGLIGMQLQGGAGFPGGANSDVIYWVAGKSFSGGA